jgi:hypothetical protein
MGAIGILAGIALSVLVVGKWRATQQVNDVGYSLPASFPAPLTTDGAQLQLVE